MTILLFLIVWNTQEFQPNISVQKYYSWKSVDAAAELCDMKVYCYPIAIEIKDDGNLIITHRVTKRVWSHEPIKEIK